LDILVSVKYGKRSKMKTLREFSKEAANLLQLRRATKALRPRILRAALRPGLGATRRYPGGASMKGLTKSTLQKLIPESSQREMLEPFLKGAGKGGRVFAAGDLSKEISKYFTGLPKLNPRSREMLNRVVLLHEGAELKRSAAKRLVPFSSHVSPKVLLDESNILATLPKSHAKVRETFANMRRGELESLPLLKRVYGKKRLSRHAKRRIGDMLEQQIPSPLETVKRLEAAGRRS